VTTEFRQAEDLLIFKFDYCKLHQFDRNESLIFFLFGVEKLPPVKKIHSSCGIKIFPMHIRIHLFAFKARRRRLEFSAAAAVKDNEINASELRSHLSSFLLFLPLSGFYSINSQRLHQCFSGMIQFNFIKSHTHFPTRLPNERVSE
jgi:hypothetical protein